MFSAHPNAERSLKEVGADEFVAKPFSVNLLLETVERLLRDSVEKYEGR